MSRPGPKELVYTPLFVFVKPLWHPLSSPLEIGQNDIQIPYRSPHQGRFYFHELTESWTGTKAVVWSRALDTQVYTKNDTGWSPSPPDVFIKQSMSKFMCIRHWGHGETAANTSILLQEFQDSPGRQQGWHFLEAGENRLCPIHSLPLAVTKLAPIPLALFHLFRACLPLPFYSAAQWQQDKLPCCCCLVM